MNQVIERLELQPHLNTRISDMSFGTKKKVLLSSALIGQPDFIILDEPLNGLDKKSQHALLMLLQTPVRSFLNLICSKQSRFLCQKFNRRQFQWLNGISS